MVFSSLVFLFVFFSLTMAVYLFVPGRKRNLVLLIASLIFYGWGGPMYLLLLLTQTVVSYLCALQIAHTRNPKKKKLWLIVECAALLGLLAYFKYTPLIARTMQFLSGFPEFIPDIILPIGISFYTFQLPSYVIDVYWGKVEVQRKFSNLLLYSSLFHQCIAGPIVRYQTVADEIENRRVSFAELYSGVRRFTIGLAKKAILANGVATIADSLASTDPEVLAQTPALGIWLGLLCYMLQIYLDFSAYSDMAIGMGQMVGFHYMENFNYPYMAISVQDFWRRWHISLSTFFRDYVYIPLGGSRQSTLIYVRNMIVVWFLTGLWHGASWNFILWGLYYLVFLLLEKFVIRQRIPNGWNVFYTLSVVFVGWILFRYQDLTMLKDVFAGMFGLASNGWFSYSVLTSFLSNLFLIGAAVIGCTNLSVWVERILARAALTNRFCFVLYSWEQMLLPVVLLILSILALIGDVYNPFLYFQF